MNNQEFDRSKHIYQNNAFVELVKDAIRFFHGTPVHTLPPLEAFCGAGVYAIYYIGENPLYKKYAEWNRLSYDKPIYVGKAVPKGWRSSRNNNKLVTTSSRELNNRLKEHKKSISATSDLNVADFMCRFMIFEGETSDMIGTIEAALIKLYQPLWNSCVDGFGNHDPGSGRSKQAKSDWDVLHPGRVWADKLSGASNARECICEEIFEFLSKI